MKYIYPAFFYEEESGYSVIFPDWSATSGVTLQEAHDMAVDYLYAEIKWCLKNGQSLPPVSDISTLKPATDFEYKKAFSSLVSVDIKEYEKYLAAKSKAVRKNVTIPEWLAEIADKGHINYSSVLQDALREKLGVNG